MPAAGATAGGGGPGLPSVPGRSGFDPEVLARGRLLLALAGDARGRDAADEARTLALRAAADFERGVRLTGRHSASSAVRCRALLDLAEARAVASGDGGHPGVLEALRQAVDAVRDQSPGLRVPALRRLAEAHTTRYRHTAELTELTAADVAFAEAETLVDRDDPLRAELLAGRGEVLVARAERTGPLAGVGRGEAHTSIPRAGQEGDLTSVAGARRKEHHTPATGPGPEGNPTSATGAEQRENRTPTTRPGQREDHIPATWAGRGDERGSAVGSARDSGRASNTETPRGPGHALDTDTPRPRRHTSATETPRPPVRASVAEAPKDPRLAPATEATRSDACASAAEATRDLRYTPATEAPQDGRRTPVTETPSDSWRAPATETPQDRRHAPVTKTPPDTGPASPLAASRSAGHTSSPTPPPGTGPTSARDTDSADRPYPSSEAARDVDRGLPPSPPPNLGGTDRLTPTPEAGHDTDRPASSLEAAHDTSRTPPPDPAESTERPDSPPDPPQIPTGTDPHPTPDSPLAVATEAVRLLRAAIALTPSSDPQLADRRLLFGRALRHHHGAGGTPTDLHEAEWVLARAARDARDDRTAALAWLERGDVLLRLAERTGAPEWLDRAAESYRYGVRSAERAGEPLLAARAHHQRGVVLERTAGPKHALESYRAAWALWQRAGAAQGPRAQSTFERMTALGGTG